MKEKTGIFIPYVCMVISLFLPWFTYDARMMGYCWGTQYVLYFLIPLVLVGLYLFSAKSNWLHIILAEFGAVMNLVLLVLIFGTWQEGRNIVAGFHWRDGFETAQPAFWCAAASGLCVFAFLQQHIFRKKERA